MTKKEKDQLIIQMKSKVTDWNTDWNQGRVQGLNEAIKIIESIPVDPELIPGRSTQPSKHWPTNREKEDGQLKFLNELKNKFKVVCKQ